MEGNQQKMREALLKLRAEIERFYNNEWIPYDAWQGCDDMISHALSAPARQCDVGTAEEQTERFIDYCCSKCDGSKCGLTLYREDEIYKCAIKWAQMPYEAQEGAVK